MINKKLQKSTGVLHPIVVQPKIWCKVGMDLLDSMPEPPRVHKYIITLTDYFSKWAEAASLQDTLAVGVANFIYSVSHYISRIVYQLAIRVIIMICPYGSPEVLITNQGREFVNSVSSELYSTTKTEHRITSAYHPQVHIHKFLVYVYSTLIYILVT